MFGPYRVVLVGALGACAGTIGSPPPASYDEHVVAAERHDQAAQQHEGAAAVAEARVGPEAYVCGDGVLNDQLTTGGLPVTTWNPCWNGEEEAALRQLDAAEHERRAAERERHAAQELIDAERVACAKVSPEEREHSPFAHRQEVMAVLPERAGGELRGVRVVFSRVRGLTADWMRDSIACQQARWAMSGEDPALMPDDPTLVAGAQTTVFDQDGQVVVVVTADSPAVARVALARARHRLTGPRTATR